MEKWEARSDFSFLSMYLVGGRKMERKKKFFCLVKEKSERIKNVIYIN